MLTALKSLAKRHQSLAAEITQLDTELTTLIEQTAPYLLHLHGVGNVTAAQLLITVGGDPDRLRSEASFAALCGTALVPHPQARPPVADARAAGTVGPTTPCTPSPWPGCTTIRRPNSSHNVNATGVHPRDPADPQTSNRPRHVQTDHPDSRRS